jgi:hypothetical protein
MKSYVTQAKLLTSLLLAAIIPLAMLGCNTTPTTGVGTIHSYRLTGAAVMDPNRGSTTIGVDYQRDGATLSSAIVTFDGDTLMYNFPGFPTPDVFSELFASPNVFPIGKRIVRARDSSLRVSSDTVTTIVTDTFSITNVVPTIRVVRGLHSVSLAWDVSGNATGYVMAAVLRQDAYKGNGYSAYATSLNTAGTLPPEAFTPSGGILPDTGWYYLYVYSYTGYPDSTLTSYVLPVPMPSALPDNIRRDGLTGRFGSIRVALFDSVYVTYEL